ncbi:TolC family protein [Chromobacterium sp. IIBBL 290-4]|uniref:TolC family protein n=1 Tax=Chromobacterium sp. IIBBL 290-4 TaxID=2953890 RepID=UPI0020B8854F|nr:TolC family protein [Chromobacterium sp. IIBBL 290-4]UTH76393.1 TolC family protein [Chromobacterium sp. IIBBL 290-4]
MNLKFFLIQSLLVCGKCLAWDAYPTDPLWSQSATIPTQEPCSAQALPKRLDLPTAVDMSLCHDPQTREAWASIKLQEAELGQARAAYLPKLEGNTQWARDHNVANTPAMPYLNTTNSNSYRTDSASLSWLLYDFGARSARHKVAEAGLRAALASQQAVHALIFATVVRDFYAVAAAQATLTATRINEHNAANSLKAATAKTNGGVAAISDQLQAETALSQSAINRIKAEQQLAIAQGNLALDMGLPANSHPAVTELSPSDTGMRHLDSDIQKLLTLAQSDNPELISARENLAAAQAKADQAAAEGRPSVTLTLRANHSNQPESLGTGMPQTPANNQQRYAGIQLSIPLFDGFERTYRIHGATAEVARQQAILDGASQKISRAVWKNYQEVQAGEDNLSQAKKLLQIAERAFAASSKRYQVGAADVQELMSVQSNLASARQQHIQAMSDLLTARYQLAQSIGRLGDTTGSINDI